MPRMTTLTSTIASLSFTFQDSAGRIARSGVTGLTAAPASIAITNLSNALGDCSNAALIANSGTAQTVDTPADRVVFDEAYSGVTEKLTLVFQNSARRTKRLDVPAPDASLFGADGVTVDYDNAQIIALIAAYQVVVGSQYTLKRGFLTSRSRKAPTGNRPPLIAEPVSPQLPPGEPALPA